MNRPADTHAAEAQTIRSALFRMHASGTSWNNADRLSREALSALDRLLAALSREQQRREPFEAVERAAQKVERAFTAESEDWNDGTYALWQKDDLIAALVELRAALAVPDPTPPEENDRCRSKTGSRDTPTNAPGTPPTANG